MDFYHKKKRDLAGISGVITVKSQKLRPNSIVKGVLQIENKAEKFHHGIRVQLEAILSTGSSQNKLHDSCCERRDELNLMPGAEDLRLGKSYISYSPTGCQILGKSFNHPQLRKEGELPKQTYSLLTGTTSYLFSFVMTREHLAASFKTWHRESLEYRIVAYMREGDKFVRVAARTIPFGGYQLLPDSQPSSLLPLGPATRWTLHTAKFNVKGLEVKIELAADKPGYLPDEKMDVRISMGCSYHHVTLLSTITVTFVKRVKINLNGIKKEDDKVLSEFQDVVKSNEKTRHAKGHSVIFGGFRVPHHCPPSHESPHYSVIYLFKYEAKVAGYPTALRGEMETTIGTSRGENGLEQFIDDQIAELHLLSTRYDSEETIYSDYSIAGTSKVLPPAYSQLSSRAGSLLSLETLPPNYEDVS